MKNIHLIFLLNLFILFLYTNKTMGQGASCAQATQLCDSPACGEYELGNGQADDPIASESSSCLGSDPNATWFFLIDDQGGGGAINITNTPACDTDFAAWGPFDSPADALAACGGLSTANEVGCDYSTSPGGTINMPGTSAVGDVYLMVITNFSNDPGITVNVTAPPLQCCPQGTGAKADVTICSGDAAPVAAIADFEGSAAEITGSSQFIADLGLSTSNTALVAPAAADFTNNTCAPIDLVLYYLFDCDENCDGAGDGPAVAGSFTVTIYPDATTFVATETPGACGAAATVSIASADGTVCFSDAGAVPADLGCNMNDDQSLTYAFDPGFPVCNMMFSATVAAICVGTGCACTDPCFVEYDPAAAPPGDPTICVTAVPPTPCDDGDPCTENDMEIVGGDGSNCAPCVGMVVAPPNPAFSVTPNPVSLCGGPVAITATTVGGIFTGSGAPLVVGTNIDPSGGNVGVTYNLTYTVSTPGGCMDTSTITFSIVNDCDADGGAFPTTGP